MEKIARDSGISVDNDNDSYSSATSSSRENNQLSYVQRLRKRFECLATEQEREFHDEVNWWLHEESEVNEQQHEEEEVTDTDEGPNHDLFRIPSIENEVKTYSKQSSIKSQVSRDSSRGEVKLIITPSTPVKSPSTPKDFPILILSDYQENNETNDTDSFDSASEDENEVFEEKVEDLVIHKYQRQLSNALSPTRPGSITSQTSNTSSKLFNIIRELLENEENYVRSLKTGIKNYLEVFNREQLPKTLRGQKHRIFANIKTIYNFHQHEFLPSLMKCSDDPEQIAEVFTSFVTRDFFYGYIIYAINRKRSEMLCNDHADFWKKIQNECGDRLGINSFLLQPIQRLPRYQMLLNEIIKDLSKDLELSKQAIAACCVAEKNMQRLLDTVNESMSINDIRNCYEIDVLCQGKFKKMDEFDMYDWELKKRFRGKVFLFENCVIYTEALNREYMEYRGHFDSDKLGIIYKEGKSKFRLFSKKRGQKEVEFRTSINKILEWNEIITGMLIKFAIAEKKRHENKRKSSVTSIVPIPIVSNRASMISTISDQSNYSIKSYRSSSGSSSLGRDSYDPRSSQWYI